MKKVYLTLMSDMEESSKAVAEVAKLGTASVDAGVKLGGFLAKVLGEPFQEAVGLFGDKLKLYRFQNQVAIMDKVNKILNKRKVSDTIPIPPKFAIPAMEYASLEEDENIQDIWCKLLANGLDPNRNVEIKYSYIEIIKSLTPLDALVLKKIYDSSVSSQMTDVITTQNVLGVEEMPIDYYDVLRELPTKRPWAIRISLCNLMRMQCITESGLHKTVSDLLIYGKKYCQFNEAYQITYLGYDFVQACMIY